MPEHEKHLQPRKKVVLVTGASRGIGAAAAKRLGKSGASVIVKYHHNREAAQKVLDEVTDAGGGGMLFQADVTRKDQVDLMIQAARERYCAIDILVNNAYFPFQLGQLHELSWDDLHRAIEHELMAFCNCVQACCRTWLKSNPGRLSWLARAWRNSRCPNGRLCGCEIGSRIDGQYHGNRVGAAWNQRKCRHTGFYADRCLIDYA